MFWFILDYWIPVWSISAKMKMPPGSIMLNLINLYDYIIVKEAHVFRINYDVACPMNFRKYPYDTQVCRIKYESCKYHASSYIIIHHNHNHHQPYNLIRSTPTTQVCRMKYEFCKFFSSFSHRRFCLASIFWW